MMYSMSREEEVALYVLWGVFRGMDGFSGFDISFEKSQKGDSLDCIVGEFKVAQTKSDVAHNYFARFCAADAIEVWSEESPTLPDVVKNKVVAVVPDAVYKQVDGRHRWKSNNFKEWFDRQYQEI